jgi:hypothetical protein
MTTEFNAAEGSCLLSNIDGYNEMFDFALVLELLQETSFPSVGSGRIERFESNESIPPKVQGWFSFLDSHEFKVEGKGLFVVLEVHVPALFLVPLTGEGHVGMILLIVVHLEALRELGFV